MVNGINGAYNPYQYSMLDQTYYNPVQYQQPILTGGVSTTSDVRFNAPPKDNTADGKDDGKITFWNGVKNFGKGILNFVLSPITDEKGDFSITKAIKSTAIALAFVAGNVVTGGALTPILLAAGMTFGTLNAVKAGINIYNAKTDAEAEAACQSLGSSVTAVATSVWGARGYAKANGVDVSGIKGTKNAVVKTFQDAGSNISAGKTYLFGQSAKDAVIKDGIVKSPAREATPGKIQEKWQGLKDSYKNSSENGVYNKVKDVASQELNSATQRGENFFKSNSQKYNDYISAKADNAELTLSGKDKFNVLKETVSSLGKKEAAQLGYTKGQGFLKNTKAIATNPQNIAIHNSLVSNTVKPDFYDSLSREEQRYFDSLPKEQREQLEDYYYAMV